MIDFVNYLLTELKSGRLEKADVLQLLAQHQHGLAGDESALHPLLHTNTSSMSGQRFSSTLSGEEFFLSDHVVKGQRVLPGVAYLEMAHAAFLESLETETTGSVAIELKNVVWLQPVVVNDSQSVHIALDAHENGEIEFAIYTEQGEGSEEETIHAQGRAMLVTATEEAAQIDLAALRTQCTQSIEITQCYAAFDTMGIHYGPAHRGLTSVQVGADSEGQRFVLAQVKLPECVRETRDQYVLHPSVLDSALQAAIGLSLEHATNEGSTQPMLPFALERLEILARSQDVAWVVVRPRASHISSTIQKLDIEICDDLGRVCVRLSGFTSRVLAGELHQEQDKRTLLLAPSWESKPLAASSVPMQYRERWVVLASLYKEWVPELQAQHPSIHWAVLQDDVIAAAHQLFAQAQSILQSKPKYSVLLQLVVAESDAMALSGLLKSAHQENPKFIGQVLGLSKTAGVEEIAKAVAENASEAAQSDQTIRYAEGVREVSRFAELSAATTPSLPWKDNGVYVITGGAGGLGLIVAREIASQVQGARIILTGRSDLSEEKQAQVKSIEQNEAHIEYRVLDVRDANSVTMCAHSVVEHYGALNGIIHSAGVIRDNFVIKKTQEEFAQVLAPKVTGTLNLDRATQEIELDCFILFSSMAGAVGNVGQSYYAIANGFMDHYAAYRNELVRQGHRHGRTLSINWPLWANGGMHIDEATQESMRRQGLDVLTTTSGIDALYRAWASDASQVMVLAGDRQKLKRLVGLASERAVIPSPDQTTVVINVNHSELHEKTQQHLKKLLSSALKLPADRIESDAGFEKYGIDSILALKLVSELEASFGSLPKTLMFEYQSIEALAGYFIEHHREALISHLKLTKRALTRPAAPVAKTALAVSVNTKRRRGRFALQIPSEQVQANSVADIAIIGISGRYPQANNIHEYWENLKAGKDCITEIPSTRWDYREYFDAEKGKPGKSYSKWGGFIEGVDEFDPLFFNISPREAQFMDPQERLFLQCVYQTIEDAGYTRETLKAYRSGGLDGNVGVFVGVMYEEYQLFGAQAQVLGQPYALGGNPSSIANRVSYFCNFHGPSMAVDTMCSSSLTAIHLACQSIKNNGCELAIAGGVNVSIHPNKYLALSQGQFASSTGRCESFGQGGDGYVPGEGVGAVLLKPLSQAIDDHDHIYGVIKGTSINHGGKTNGYTVPNPSAQAQVIASALQDAKIDPRTISYIEAHGTGTSLGDPIEIAGLTHAFEQYTQEKQYCAIGSAKSHIGHLESAAGIAALTKVLLQMQHQTLVPSLHSATLNPHIDFTNTPFKVQQSVEEWSRPIIDIDDTQKEYPRIAGISSFGAGGANAHVIIEEYSEPQEARTSSMTITTERPVLIVLSAKSEDQLQERVRQLLSAIARGDCNEANLPNIAYTLQVGREAMEQRLALTARLPQELNEKLAGYLAGKTERGEIEECYRGEVKRNKETLSTFNADEDTSILLNTWLEKGKYTKLLELWVKGLAFDWATLYDERSVYGEIKPKRLSLPTYPFAKERYWIEVSQPSTALSGVSSVLHPLLQQNTSDLNEQRFSSVFTGKEFYLSDHVVSGNKVLSGVAYLEMARAAVERSVGLGTDTGMSVALQNVVWLQPVVVKDSQSVHIALDAHESGAIEFEIYTQQDGEHDDAIVHAQGRATLVAAAAEAEQIDLTALRSQCTRSLEITRCYEAFSAMGITYGPAHRGLTSVQIGVGADDQRFVLAQVTLPECVSETRDQYVLHPSVLDSALQASIGLSFDQSHEGSTQPMLPFALERLEILERSPDIAWVVVRPSASHTNSSIQKLDIDICDESGRVCVRLSDFTSRVLAGELQHPREEGALLLTPSWDAKSLTTSIAALEYGEHWVWVDSTYKEWLPSLKAQHPPIQWAVLQDDVIAAAHQLFAQAQGILQAKPKQSVLLQVVVVEGEAMALSGLLKSAHQENPKFIGQVILLSHTASVEEIAIVTEENASEAAQSDQTIRYVEGAREVSGFAELSVATTPSVPWKDNGVYLITGGAGGLGLIVAKEIASQVQGAQIILTGRSVLSEAKQTQIQAIEQNGARIEYRVLDVSDANSVTMCVHLVVEHYGALNGIIHSAGVIHDNFIIKKTAKELQQVLVPKVTGTLNLDRATQEIELDFFILFSSVAGALGNVGQSDYATANAFMDRYAAYRNQLIRKKERHGRTLSINWPLWASGGMRIDAATHEQMHRQGLDALSTSDGIDALYQAWASGEAQVLVLAGERQKLKQLLHLAPPSAFENEVKAVINVNHSELQEKTLQHLKKLLSVALKLPAERIESDAGFEKYGIDSILALKLVNELEASFGSLPKTLMFEYQSIEALAGYFIEHHREALIAHLKLTARALTPTASTAIAKIAPVTASANSKRRRGRFTVPASDHQANTIADIAIIGLSGRYPGANNINEYWENLKAGKDCITEIPQARWDYRDYFDAEKGKPGKSYSKWGGFIEGVDEFDPLFFNISPREAQFMDPQERLFLQCVYQTLEDAGYTRDTLKAYRSGGVDGNVGVFVGVMYEEYQLYGAQAQALGQPYALGGNPSSIANRVSYYCNFHGPSMAVDTMCSSSLTAIHLACQSIKHNGCELAIAGGVNVSIHPNKYLALSQGQFASSTGRCESFGEGGDGYVPGEGVGAVLLKPLNQAIADQDRIYGVIKGTSINHGGKTNGYTVPNPSAQAQVIASALQDAKIDPRTISYIEAHGTGTSLGDPIEIAGLTHAFEQYTQEKQYCAIGSAKSNIGHLESAAGIAALTKVLLQMQHQALVPSLHSQTLNPHINFANTPFKVQQTLEVWQRPTIEIEGIQKEYPRTAGISSFGAGGANAHVIIEEYSEPQAAHHAIQITLEHPALIVLSAKNEERLQEQVKQLLDVIRRGDCNDTDLSNIAYTLQVGREAMDSRLAMIVNGRDELIQGLEAYLIGNKPNREIDTAIPLFTGSLSRDLSHLGDLSRGKVGEAIVALIVAEQDLEKLAVLWTQGARVPWSALHAEHPARIIPLPTYPFAKERYWIPTSGQAYPLSDPLIGISAEEYQLPLTALTVRAHGSVRSHIEDFIAQFLAEALALTQDRIDLRRDLQEYGVDSIIGIKLVRTLETEFNVQVSGREMLEHRTITALAKHLTTRIEEYGDIVKTQSEPAASIELQAEPQKLPLSEGQKGLWMLQKFHPDMSAYNVPLCLRFDGKVHRDALAGAYRFLLQQHPILATVIQIDKGVPCLVSQVSDRLSLPKESIDGMDTDALMIYLNQKAKEPFALDGEPLLRASLLSRSTDEHFLLLVVHHVIFDGRSVPLLLEALFGAYERLAKGQKPQLVHLPASYADFVDWEQQMLASDEAQAHRSYWMQQLAGPLPVMELHTDRARRTAGSADGKTYTREISTSLARRVKAFGITKGISAAAIFLSVYKVLLHRYTAETDIIVGMPTLGRPQDRFDRVIGYFVNMVALRSEVSSTRRFDELLQDVQLTLVDAMDHAVYPFLRIVRDLNISSGRQGSPIFQVAFAYQNASMLNPQRAQPLVKGEQSLKLVAGIGQEGEYELVLEVMPDADGFNLRVKYDARLYDRSTIIRMIDHYEQLLESAMVNSDREIGVLSLLSDRERFRLIEEFNATAVAYPQDKLIHELFEEQVARTPEAIAVIYEAQQLTYGELNRRANQLAHYLREQGVEPDQLVAICVERSMEMMVGLLGILKAGGAYVPLDPSYPPDRLGYMLTDSKPRVMLTQEHLKGALPKTAAAVIGLDSEWHAIAKHSSGNLDARKLALTPQHLAYVIYTSGSTGQPKGVMVEHGGLRNYLQWAVREYIPEMGAGALVTSSLAFDATVTSLYTPLLCGRPVVLVPDGQELDGLEVLLRGETVWSLVKISPAHLDVLGQRLLARRQTCAARAFVIGGEALSPSTVKMWQSISPETRLINEYGPTETVVGCSIYDIPPHWSANQSVPIGRPISNTQMYILDSYRQPVPIGVAGEIYIGGVGIARGYWNRLELTAERFLKDPFSNDVDARMYKTGDLGRWRADGNIEYLCRNDHQVKIRGFRIELGEIESCLMGAAEVEVKEAVVIAREDVPGDKRLVAYLAQGASAPNIEALRAHVKASLPEYMIPSAFVWLEKFPLTPNGKLDRKALPAPELNAYPVRQYEAPQGEIEEALAVIWQELLRVERVGRRDGFFALGGHSLLAVQFIARAEAELSVRIPLSTFFQQSTIAELAASLNCTQRERSSSSRSSTTIDKVDGHRLFLVHPIGGHGLAYRELADSLQSFGTAHLLQRPELADGAAVRFLTTEQLCDAYVDEILAIDNKGPYRLCGWSLGAVLAFQLAVKLESLGKEVAYLGMIDGVAPIDHAKLFEGEFSNIAGRDVSQELRRWPQPLVDKVLQLWRRNPASQDVAPAHVPNATDQYFHLFVANLWLGQVSLSPNVKLCSKHAYLYFASESLTSDNAMTAVQLKLRQFFKEPAKIVQIPGGHFEIMAQPIVEDVAKMIDEDAQRSLVMETKYLALPSAATLEA